MKSIRWVSAGLFIFLGMAYLNFSSIPASPSAAETVLQARMNWKDKVQFLTQSQGPKPSQALCADSQSYFCFKKVFSSGESDPNSALQEVRCVRLSSGGEICPHIEASVYDTRAARAHCGDKCDESYDYVQFDCDLKWKQPHQALFPLSTSENNLEEAIEKLHQACQSASEGS